MLLKIQSNAKKKKVHDDQIPEVERKIGSDLPPCAYPSHPPVLAPLQTSVSPIQDAGLWAP